MARPLRIEFPGALYYISSVGNGGNNIFKDSEDGNLLLEALEGVCIRFNWKCLAFSFLSDCYHLVIETPQANLSKGMRQLNGTYTQNYNRRHDIGGHVFQGRYKSILVQRDKFLVPLIKEIFLFPLNAGFVKNPREFKWASCKYLYEKEEAPNWLESSWFSEGFNSVEDLDHYIMDGETPHILAQTRKQIYLGDDDFILDVQKKIDEEGLSKEIPRTQITKPVSKTYSEILKRSRNQDEAIAKTYLTGNYTLKQIGDYIGLHYSGISKIVSEYEKKVVNT